MPSLRREVLRPRQTPGRMRALRRRGRSRPNAQAAAREGRRDGGSRGQGGRRPAARRWRNLNPGEALVERAGRGARPGQSLATGWRATGVSAVRLRRRRQDDAGSTYRGRRAGRGGFRRLHGQGGAGAALKGLRRRFDDPRADLSCERGRGGSADIHAQQGRPGLARRPDRDRRVLDGRRGTRARSALVPQTDPGSGRSRAVAAGQGRRFLHRRPNPT